MISFVCFDCIRAFSKAHHYIVLSNGITLLMVTK
jgi:hypothetical protein